MTSIRHIIGNGTKEYPYTHALRLEAIRGVRRNSPIYFTPKAFEHITLDVKIYCQARNVELLVSEEG